MVCQEVNTVTGFLLSELQEVRHLTIICHLIKMKEGKIRLFRSD